MRTLSYTELPRTNDPRQVFTVDVTVDSVALHARVELRYLSAPDQWVISIWDNASSVLLINQIPLFCSCEELNDLLLLPLPAWGPWSPAFFPSGPAAPRSRRWQGQGSARNRSGTSYDDFMKTLSFLMDTDQSTWYNQIHIESRGCQVSSVEIADIINERRIYDQMRKMFAILLILMIAAGCAGCSKPSESVPEPSVSNDAEQAEPVKPENASLQNTQVIRLEGPGYDTPEESVLAFIDGMNRGDVGGMLSTFAMETYVEHINPTRWLENTGSYKTVPASAMNSIPVTDEYIRSMLTNVRYGVIATDIYACYAMNAVQDSYARLETEEDREALAKQFRESYLYDMAGKVEFVQWLNPAIVSSNSSNLMTPGVGTNNMESLSYAGGDDYTELLAVLRIDGNMACQPMRCVRYGNRWYNLDFSSRAAQYAGVREQYRTIPWMPANLEEAGLLMKGLAAPETKESKQWDALQQSDWAGTRWPLVSVNIPGVTVHDTAEAAENDVEAGIWAEVHFTRLGGAEISLAVSPALQRQLNLAEGGLWIDFSWFTDEIPTVRVNGKTGKAMSTFVMYAGSGHSRLDVSAVDMTSTRVAFQLADGTRAVFEKPPVVMDDPAPAENIVAATRLEGNGYDSPEDAVLAFIEAMNRGNVRDMLSTFTYETYAAHVDPAIYQEAVGTYTVRNSAGMPIEEEYARSLSAYARYAEIANNLLTGFLAYSVEDYNKPVQLKSDQEIRDFMDRFSESPLAGLTGNVAFVNWINTADLTEGAVVNAANTRTLGFRDAYCNFDDIAEPVARILVNGKVACLGMRCVEYDGRWYNLFFGNMPLDMLQVSRDLAGLCLFTDERASELWNKTASPEERALQDALRRSELSGTRWQLVSLKNTGITVHDSKAAAKADSGIGVWAELRLTGVGGGVLSFAGNETLQKLLNMPGSSILYPFSWEPDDTGGFRIRSNEMMNRFADLQFNLENIIIVRNESEITVTFPNGTQAILQKK